MTKTLFVPEYLKNQLEKNKPQTDDLKLKERLPQPTGWRILVMPYKGREKTDGGIHLPDGEPWCKEGDWICIGRYSGSRFRIEGGEVRIINDDEVIATIVDPEDIQHI